MAHHNQHKFTPLNPVEVNVDNQKNKIFGKTSTSLQLNELEVNRCFNEAIIQEVEQNYMGHITIATPNQALTYLETLNWNKERGLAFQPYLSSKYNKVIVIPFMNGALPYSVHRLHNGIDYNELQTVTRATDVYTPTKTNYDYEKILLDVLEDPYLRDLVKFANSKNKGLYINIVTFVLNRTTPKVCSAGHVIDINEAVAIHHINHGVLETNTQKALYSNFQRQMVEDTELAMSLRGLENAKFAYSISLHIGPHQEPNSFLITRNPGLKKMINIVYHQHKTRVQVSDTSNTSANTSDNTSDKKKEEADKLYTIKFLGMIK